MWCASREHIGPPIIPNIVNDFPNCTDKFDYFLFADDTSLSLRFPRENINTVHVQINEYLHFVSKWLIANKLMINTEKTKYMIFSYRDKFVLPYVKFDGAVIECVQSIR